MVIGGTASLTVAIQPSSRLEAVTWRRRAKGRAVTAGNIVYYVVLHLKSGQRSQSANRTDAMSPGTMLDGKSTALSLEEPVGMCPETGQTVALGDLLAGTYEDPASAAARNV